jgi:ATP-binding protein involved in chromosome partitioning
MPTQIEIESIIKTYIDPYLKQDFITTRALRNIVIENEKITLDITVGYPIETQKEKIIAVLREKLHLDAIKEIQVNLTSHIVSHAIQSGLQTIPSIKNIFAIASGKGGVGKSTSTVNLALALAADGARVGILDADIYGPNQPHMLGIHQKPLTNDDNKMEPLVNYGVQSMSIGYLVEPDAPMVWRGPMVTSALQQLLNGTNWDNLDYLLIDLPPGTGDIQLTLAQKIPVSGAIIVTTPQDIALLDARKAIAMFQKVNVPILGVIENMSLHTCSQCGHQESIFGAQGGERLAKQFEVELLGSLPLDIRIREQSDQGKPTVVADPSHPISEIYKNIARRVSAKLSLTGKSFASKFPKIVVEK